MGVHPPQNGGIGSDHGHVAAGEAESAAKHSEKRPKERPIRAPSPSAHGQRRSRRRALSVGALAR